MNNENEKYAPLTSYLVRVPVCGYVEVSVDASNEQEAIDKSFELAGQIKSELPENVVSFDWETYDHITRGNVFCGPLNEIEVINQ